MIPLFSSTSSQIQSLITTIFADLCTVKVKILLPRSTEHGTRRRSMDHFIPRTNHVSCTWSNTVYCFQWECWNLLNSLNFHRVTCKYESENKNSLILLFVHAPAECKCSDKNLATALCRHGLEPGISKSGRVADLIHWATATG